MFSVLFWLSVQVGNMRGTRAELRHFNDQYTSNRGDWTGANTHDSVGVGLHRPRHLETPNFGGFDQPCVQKLSRSTIESTDTTTCQSGDINSSAQQNDEDEYDGSSFYLLVHEKMVEMTVLVSAIGDKTQARNRSAQGTLPGTRCPLPLSSGVRFDNLADGTRNHLANVTAKMSTTCDVEENRACTDQAEFEFNHSLVEDSSSDSRLSDSCLADESDASVDAFQSSSDTSETSFSRRADENATEATIPFIDAPALKPPCLSSSPFRFEHTFTPTETRSSIHRVPSRSNLSLDAGIGQYGLSALRRRSIRSCCRDAESFS